MINFLLLVFVVIVILLLIRPSEVIARWHHHFDDLQLSSQDCYRTIQECIEKRQVPDARYSRMAFNEVSALSSKREYLRVDNVTYIFDICAAPYGTGFFISWWLRESKSLAELLMIRFFPSFGQKTYFQLDTQTMFREAVHRSILDAIAQMTTGKGVRGLSELEQQITTNPKFSFQIKTPT